MRRSLVLTDERARHPFLASLPPHVRSYAAPVTGARQRPSWLRDVRDFLAVYSASFLAISLYIA